MPKSNSCSERLRSILTRRRRGKNAQKESQNNANDTGDDSICSDSAERHSNEDKDIHYFNHAAQAPLSKEVQKLGIELIRATPWKPPDDDHNAYKSQARVRSLFASFVDSDENKDANAKGSRISIFPSTAFAITLAARNIARQQQQQQQQQQHCNVRILVLMDQFDSAVYPWQQVCDESGGKITLEIVKHPDDENDFGDCGNNSDTTVSGWTRAVMRKLTDDSAEDIIAACLPPLHWSDGTLLDLEAIGKACRERNIPLIVDATQAIGIMPCSVRKIRPTMLACSTHKWLRAPSGCCLAYISPEVQKTWIPLDFHGRGRDFEAGSATWDVSRNEMGPHGYPERYYNDARKFDSGGKAHPLLLPMLRAAMEEVSLIDTAEAQMSLKDLMNPLLKWAAENGYFVNMGPRAYHIIGLIPKEKTPEEMIEIAKKLADEKGVILAVRCGGFRVSSYLSNTARDVDKLIEGLEEFS
eukprot:CAMPEP_0116135642 /NCGR_PEP_ID=MMETSP0329-20121206/11298_1 /TAXON_ID=697910 /ORGANISM="Pseudo-nitzschia arenysensis, Strain B593" /LENGTH=469 /DNA_ID=CAMNT_0003630453 /DNA_START=168 /DNA_END=1577 /DNA_ORIENTATION=-